MRNSVLFTISMFCLAVSGNLSCSTLSKVDQVQEKRDTLCFELTHPTVAAFLKETDYSLDCGPSGYTTTAIVNYTPIKDVTDRPLPVRIKWDTSLLGSVSTFRLHDCRASSGFIDFPVCTDSLGISLKNLVPGQLYHYDLISSRGKIVDSWVFKTKGQLRMIELGDEYNVRDLGGWESTVFKHLDGTPMRIAYGKMFRGSEFNTEKTVNVRITDIEKHTLLDILGVQAEVDFRTVTETGTGGAAAPTPWLGDAVTYVWSESQSYKGLWGDGGDNGNSYELVKSAARAIYEQARAGRVVYFHCHGGRDRTGIQAWLIEGLCGVSESDMSKDYELTNLAGEKSTKRTGNLKTAVRNFWNNAKLQLSGDTLQQKCNDWFLKAGFTQEEIDWYINYLLE